MYDAAIIGTGPAGLSAAINLKLHNRSFLWFGSVNLSDKVEKSEKIANYPGLEMVSGAQLNQHFRSQIQSMELPITDRMVTNIMPLGDGYALLADNEIFEAKTVLFAIGAVSGKGLPGEQEFLGRGVSYCATCDGFLYRGKTIAVLCAAKRYEHEIAYLAGIAGKVYLHTTYPDSEITLPNVERLPAPVRAVCGDKRVNGITLTDGSSVDVQGMFILRSAVAPATLLPGLAMDGPHIQVDRSGKTNLPGCYAAGDCTGRPYQLAKAVGEGNTAAHAILEYLSEQG